MNFFKLGKIGAEAHWKKYHKPIEEYIVINHQKFTKEKARVIGYIMGDGSITNPKKDSRGIQHNDISFYPDDINMANLFVEDFEKLYLKKPKIKNLGKYYSVRVSSKPACDDLRKIADYSSLVWEFPDKTIKLREDKIEWVKSMFDCEACVNKRSIYLQSVSKKGIESVQRLLLELGVNVKVYVYHRENKNHSTNYILAIMGRENLLKYNNLVGFNHLNKSKKLKILTADVPERSMG